MSPEATSQPTLDIAFPGGATMPMLQVAGPFCGTIGEYQAHLDRGEDTDPACRAAHAAYWAEYLERHPEAYDRARGRAQARWYAGRALALEQPGRYGELIVAERRRGGTGDPRPRAMWRLTREDPDRFAALLTEQLRQRGIHPPAGREPDCGTPEGYQRHRRRNEKACPACRKANTVARRAYRNASPDARSRENTRSKARVRALRRLRDEFPDRFGQLAEQQLPPGETNRTAANQKAGVLLKDEHPDRFAALYAEELRGLSAAGPATETP